MDGWMNGTKSDNAISIQTMVTRTMVTQKMVGRNMVTLTSRQALANNISTDRGGFSKGARKGVAPS